VLRSFHYVIDKDGTIYQTVKDTDAARHSLLSPTDLRDTASARTRAAWASP